MNRITIRSQFKGSVIISPDQEISLRISLSELTLRQLIKALKLKKEKKKTLSEGVPNKSEISVRNLQYLPLAKQLSRIIKIKKHIAHSSIQVKQWADEIRRLCEHGNISIERVEDVLDWYAQNIGGEYIPVVESGFSLRTKFLRLEEASKRGAKVSQGKKPRIIEDGKWWYLNRQDGKYYDTSGQLLRDK